MIAIVYPTCRGGRAYTIVGAKNNPQSAIMILLRTTTSKILIRFSRHEADEGLNLLTSGWGEGVFDPGPVSTPPVSPLLTEGVEFVALGNSNAMVIAWVVANHGATSCNEIRVEFWLMRMRDGCVVIKKLYQKWSRASAKFLIEPRLHIPCQYRWTTIRLCDVLIYADEELHIIVLSLATIEIMNFLRYHIICHLAKLRPFLTAWQSTRN